MAWVFLHRPEDVFVAGQRAEAPRYRIVASVPEGRFDEDRRRANVEAITGAVLDSEGRTYKRDPLRVWVFTNEIPDGTWGGGGGIVTLADIVGFAARDPEKGRAYAEKCLGERRAHA